MVDLGIYNFIKNALAQEQTKESIEATLTAQGMNKIDIDAAIASVESGTPPIVQVSSIVSSTSNEAVSTTSNNRNWYAFRDTFWKYFIIIFILGIASQILHNGFVTLVVFVIALVLILQIVSQIGIITSEISGKKSWPLMVLGFFLAPVAFFLVYQSAKKQGWDISLTLLEGVFIALGIIQALIFIFELVAIGGIISALLFSSRVQPQAPSVNQPTVLGPSSDKNTVLAETRTEMTSIRANAELYYSQGETYGTSTDCYSGGMFTDPKIVQSIKNVTAYTEFSPTCGSNGKQYAIQAKVKDLAYVCIDSTGKDGIDSTPIPNNTVACP